MARSLGAVPHSPLQGIRATKNPKKSRRLSGKCSFDWQASVDGTFQCDLVNPGRFLVSVTDSFLNCYTREWRERRDADLSRRAEASQEKKAATVKKAQEDVDDFYVSYGNRADKARAQTRKEAEEFLANREDTAVGGTSWERIAKLVDVSGKGAIGGASGSGKERFRELLLDLRKDQDAPGAGGI